MTAPRALVVDGGTPCRGTIHTPGEKSISHRAVLIGALAEGASVIHGLSDGADVAASLAAVEAMGAGVERHDDGTVVVHGGRGSTPPPRGAARLRELRHLHALADRSGRRLRLGD